MRQLPILRWTRIGLQSRGSARAVALPSRLQVLAAGRVKAALPEVPFLCHFKRATQITEAAPYVEIVNYCKTHRDKVAQAFSTLSYFDGIHFSRRAKATALFSVGLMDTICPPSTVYAAYNAYAGPKDIRVYEYNNHEGGGLYHVVEKLKFLKEKL